MALKKTFNPMRDLKVFNGDGITEDATKDKSEQAPSKQSDFQKTEDNKQTDVPEISKGEQRSVAEPEENQQADVSKTTENEHEKQNNTPKAVDSQHTNTGESEAKEYVPDKADTEPEQVQDNVNEQSSDKIEPEQMKTEQELDLTPTSDGTSISRLNKLFLKRTALKNGSNMNETMIAIIEEQHAANPTFTDEELIAIEDKYTAVQKTNVKMLFIIPKYLKDFIDNKSAELGISRAVLQNHFLNEKRENNAGGS